MPSDITYVPCAQVLKMRFRRGHAIFVHEIWLKYVYQLSSLAPLPTLAHGFQLHPLDGIHRARALGRSAQPRCPLGVFCEPYSSFATAIPSTKSLLPLAIHHRRYRPDLGECWASLEWGGSPVSGFSPDIAATLGRFCL